MWHLCPLQQQLMHSLSMYAMYVCYSGNPTVGSVGAFPLPDIVLLLSGWWKYVTYYQLTYSDVHDTTHRRLAWRLLALAGTIIPYIPLISHLIILIGIRHLLPRRRSLSK